MRIILSYPRFPSELLQGELTQQDLPLPVTALQSGSLQSVGELWQALGGKPKASLHWTITVSVVSDVSITAPVAVDVQTSLQEGSLP